MLGKLISAKNFRIQLQEKGYGFDFKNDQPIPSTAYIVEAVPENKVFLP